MPNFNNRGMIFLSQPTIQDEGIIPTSRELRKHTKEDQYPVLHSLAVHNSRGQMQANPHPAPSFVNPPIPPLGFGNGQDKTLSNLEKVFPSFMQTANAEGKSPSE